MNCELVLKRYDDLNKRIDKTLSPQDAHDFGQMKSLDNLLGVYVNSNEQVKELFRHIIKKDFEEK